MAGTLFPEKNIHILPKNMEEVADYSDEFFEIQIKKARNGWVICVVGPFPTKEFVAKTDEELKSTVGKIISRKTDNKIKGVTSQVDEHRHDYEIDENGKGKTTNVDDHIHEIEEFQVLEANEHTHDIPQ